MVSFAALLFLSIAGCGSSSSNTSSNSQGNTGSANKSKPTVVFADPQWASVEFANAVAGKIIKSGYGYKTDVTPGTTPVTFKGLEKGDIDVLMEAWTNNIQKIYNQAIKAGTVKEVGVNFNDDMQGFYVPTYMIKGDPKRGIKPITPNLKTVQDLSKYAKVFQDPTDPSKGRIYGAPSSWAVDKIMQTKVKTYGLDKEYNYFHPGSSAALAASIEKAYKAGKPWVGYYWSPTWILGKYKMTLLKEPAYDKKTWDKNKGTAFPADKVTIAVNSKFAKQAPDVVKFLSKYHTDSAIINKALAYMQNNNVKAPAAATWWLKNNESTWTQWVPADVAAKVKKSLN